MSIVRAYSRVLVSTDAEAIARSTASAEQVDLNPPHPPHENAIEAFISVEHTIKTEILKSRHHWEKHEPRMWSRAEGIPDHELVTFTIHKDLVEIRSGVTSYGTIILGKIRLPAVNDAEGEGYIHVRYAVIAHSSPPIVLKLYIGFTILPTGYASCFPTSRLSSNTFVQGVEDVLFHSLWTDEGNRDADGHPTTWRAIQNRDTPLEFFNE